MTGATETPDPAQPDTGAEPVRPSERVFSGPAGTLLHYRRTRLRNQASDAPRKEAAEDDAAADEWSELAGLAMGGTWALEDE